MKIILSSDQYFNCPICGVLCTVHKVEGFHALLNKSGRFTEFFHFDALATDPLHYYTHIVDESAPTIIACQEFAIDVGTKVLLVANDYQQQKTFIRTSRYTKPLEVPMIIIPDFPDLEILKRKVRTSLVFS